MLRSKSWKFIGVGLGVAIIVIGGLLLIGFLLLFRLDDLGQTEKISLGTGLTSSPQQSHTG